MVVASSRLCDDFHAAEARAAELGAVRIIVDANLLDVILRRNLAGIEAIDDERYATAGTATRPGNLLEISGEFVFVIGQ